MSNFWQGVRGYIWWTHDRGSIQYDVMVTFILLFIFLAPRKINFKDTPATPPHHNQIVAYSGGDGFVYEVPTGLLPQGEADTSKALAQALQPAAGALTVTNYEPLRDSHGTLVAYRVWIARPGVTQTTAAK